MAQDSPSKSWFLTYNHPQETIRYKTDSNAEYIRDVNNNRIIESVEPNEYAGLTPEELCEKMLDLWCSGSETRTAACSYCISAKGLHHLHMVVEDAVTFRFSKVKQAFPRAHIEPTRGNKSQAENYINKRGAWAEKGEQVICIRYRGEIQGRQGKRSDLEEIEKQLREGVHPNDILLSSLSVNRHSKLIKEFYSMIRSNEVPFLRTVKVYWHVGPTGCGKTYVAVDCYNKNKNDFYFVTNYRNGFLDKYCAEKILFLDEFKGQLSYADLLVMLQGYKGEMHARFSNVIGLWEEVHITSIYPPERLYQKMVDIQDRDVDTLDQLKRRITGIYYHWKDDDSGQFRSYYCEMQNYISYGRLVIDAVGIDKGFRKLSEDEEKFVQQSFLK